MGRLSDCRPTWAEIDLAAVVANFRTLRRHVGGRDVWAVVKADAYGHGATEVARALGREPVAGFCVATASEGRELRLAGVAQPILVLAGVWAGGAEDAFGIVAEYGLSAAIQDPEGAAALSRAAREGRVGPASVHLKVDTGMGRLGVIPARALELARAIDRDPALSLDGLFSNLATADSIAAGSAGAAYVADQARAFVAVCGALDAEGLLPAHRTLANSAAALHHPATWEDPAFTGVRPGLALYGASLNPGHDPRELRPAMRLRTQVVAIRDLPDDTPVGYELTFRAQRQARVAVLPVGYHDGYPRSLSNRAHVWLRGRRVPVIGRISMDMTLVDVTDLPSTEPGDEVVLLGPATGPGAPESRDSRFASMLEAAVGAAGEERGVGVEEVAAWAGTIPHEILCRVGDRVPRRYREAAEPSGGRR